VIAPPYTAEFVTIFYPLIENPDITGMLRTGTDDQMSEFISKSYYLVVVVIYVVRLIWLVLVIVRILLNWRFCLPMLMV